MAKGADAAAQDQHYAAIDLGSNSFHLVVATSANDRIQVIDRHKEMLGLAAGLGADNRIGKAKAQEALNCLERFGERLRHIPAANVRVVGTNTLRQASNGAEFIAEAERRLGHGIEVVSGREEARLIFMGVSYALQDNGGRRLVMDIGGGSTELIVGRPFQPELLESLDIGCINLSERYFAGGQLSTPRMTKAVLGTRQELEPLEQAFRAGAWENAIGASGSLLCIRDICLKQNWCQDGITRDALDRLRHAICSVKQSSQLQLAGLPTSRQSSIAGATAILSATFDALQIDQMDCSDGALREGLLLDLVGRNLHRDIRDHSVQDVARRYQVDQAQAARVAQTVLHLREQVARAWEIDAPQTAWLLRWAANTHEIGLDISHSQYHRHGQYLLQHMDLPGFSQGEQRRLALLVRAHRRKFPVSEFEQLPARERKTLLRLAALLRLAVVLHRSRTAGDLPAYRMHAQDDSLRLYLPTDWLSARPLTQLDLEKEAEQLAPSGIQLEVIANGLTTPR